MPRELRCSQGSPLTVCPGHAHCHVLSLRKPVSARAQSRELQYVAVLYILPYNQAIPMFVLHSRLICRTCSQQQVRIACCLVVQQRDLARLFDHADAEFMSVTLHHTQEAFLLTAGEAVQQSGLCWYLESKTPPCWDPCETNRRVQQWSRHRTWWQTCACHAQSHAPATSACCSLPATRMLMMPAGITTCTCKAMFCF